MFDNNSLLWHYLLIEKGSDFMSNISIDNSIANAVASVEMEGFKISDTAKERCKKLLNNEITMEQYISSIVPIRYRC